MPDILNDDGTRPAYIGLDMLMNMTDLDRAQEIWDRAMTPEMHEFNKKLMAFRHGRGPDPGEYTGPQVNFIKARRELDEEEPERHDE
jgi:hypothetical protein